MKISISIEGSSAKVIEAQKRSSEIIIKKASKFPLEDLDSYLKTTRHKDFIVSVDFRELYPEILNLPPVKGPDLKKVISTEVRRLYPDFYYIYHDLGERVIENKRTRSVSILRTHKSQVDELIELFVRHGKDITALFSSYSSIASFLEGSERPLLCVFETESGAPEGIGKVTVEKNIFLLKDNNILFTRILPSSGKVLSPPDIQGIEFSITHCIQNLRIPPEEVVLIGDFPDIPGSIGGIKVISPRVPSNLHYKGDEIHEYLIALGSLNLSSSEGFLPQEYKGFKFWKGFLKINTILWILLFLVFSGLSLSKFYEISSIRSETANLLTKYRAFNIFINSYNQTVQEAKSLVPYGDFLRNRHGVFVSEVLREISRFPLNKIQLKTIDIIRYETGGSVRAKISGLTASESHKERLLSFQGLVDAISTARQWEGVKFEISNKRLSIPDGRFDIEIVFTEDQKGGKSR